MSDSDLATATAHNGSLIKAVESLAQNGHSLAPIALDHAAPGQITTFEEFGDPERPIAAPEFAKSFVGERPPARRILRFAKIIAVGLFVVLLMLAWRLTPLAALTDPPPSANGSPTSPPRPRRLSSCWRSLSSADSWCFRSRS